MNRRWILWAAVALVSLAGCAGRLEVAPAPVPEPVPVPPPVAQPPKTVLPPVVILVSANIPAYTAVAERLEQRLGARARRYLMTAPLADDPRLARLLSEKGRVQVVAVGLQAALVARGLRRSGCSVVFCQVFNYADYALVSATSKGVSSIPSANETFTVWHRLAPGLRRVGVFTGAGLTGPLQQAAAAAQRHGIELVPVEVGSDKELLYRYKQMARQLDGLWLLPDNRVLSRDAIEGVMTYSMRNGKQVAVFSDELLAIGGLLSISAEPDDIAAQVMKQLADARRSGEIDGPELAELEQATIRINPMVAHRLNLTVPKELQHEVAE